MTDKKVVLGNGDVLEHGAWCVGWLFWVELSTWIRVYTRVERV